MIVEILDRRAGIRARVRLTAFPASLGRGYDNDVILDDRYADPRHARVEWDGSGGLVLVDLGSRNGVIDPATGARVPRLALRSGSEARLGHTTLRFVDPTEPVPPALAETAGVEQALIGDSIRRAALVVAGSVALFGLNNYLGTAEEARFTGVLSQALGGLLGLTVWAGGWALVSRVTRLRFRFLGHLAVASGAVAGVLVFTAVGEYLEFLFPRHMDGEIVAGVFILAIGATTLAAHLARASHLDRRRRWLWAVGLTAVLVGVTALGEAGGDRESGHDDGEAPLKPVPARFIPTTTAAAFLGRVDRLQARVDSLAIEEPEEGEDPAASSESADSAGE